ncbi:MAG TPA: hypothetical protein VJB14_13370 [Planctomycetota bacterium]|nr:hypothetical protein [Planctomycetota bacterium]
MIHGYDLYIVPRDSEYRPSNERVKALVTFLVDQLQITETFTADGEEELPLEDALQHLRAAASSKEGSSECTVSLAGTLSDTLFGREPDAPESDDFYYADELKVHLHGSPFPYGDWEYEDAHCGGCGTRLANIRDLLDDIRVSGRPVPCACGAKTQPHELRMTSGVRLAQFSIAFTGNKGWLHEVEEDREAFKDEGFLPAVAEILGTPVEVLAISN